MALPPEFQARFEMADGASPTTPHFDAKLAQRSPLSAFALLAGGDAFEVMHGRPRTWSRFLSAQHLPHQRLDRHRRDQRPVIAFRQKMP